MVRSKRRYFIREKPKWREVDKATYVRHERYAGFRNTMGQPDEPATSGFSSSNYEVEGRLIYGDGDPNES